MSKPYQIAAQAHTQELVVNKSRFICYLTPCNDAEQAKHFIKSIQALHPQASHHCYAFVLGEPNDSQRYGFSDDGEPSGTAGKPMLSVLQGSQIGEVCAVVARYFGGTKLGTGGLQRAYGGSVRQAMDLLETKIKIPMVHKALACHYSQVDDIIRLIEHANGQIIEQQFAQAVELTLALPMADIEKIQANITTLTSGSVVLKPAATSVFK